MNTITEIYQKIKAFFDHTISGMWFVHIMRQVSTTSGNIAESLFLLATLWVIINAVAHTLLTWFIPVHTIELLNYLAVIAFSALPELIIIPVIIVCFNHWCVAKTQHSKVSGTWAVLYTIPACFFLVLTIIAITKFVSTGGATFVAASGNELVIRCLSGWFYAGINMIFAKIGEPHYASRMDDKDAEITALEQANARDVSRYIETIEQLTAENETVSVLLLEETALSHQLEQKVLSLKKKQTPNTEQIHIVRPSDEGVRSIMQANPKQSVRSVAKTLGVAPSTAHRKMKRVRPTDESVRIVEEEVTG